MKIIGVEVTPITLRWGKVEIDSYGPVGEREDDVIVQIFTDCGISGLGEAMTLGPFYSAESQGTVMSMIVEYIAPQVLINEDPFSIDKIVDRMDSVVYRNTFAKSAIDFALFDIMGKSLNVPVYRLIGGLRNKRISLRQAIGINTPDKMAEEAISLTKAGFGIKMKVGLSPKKDVENLARIREGIGPEAKIDVDVNQGYTVKTAIQTIRKMEKYAPILVEQPVARDDLEGMVRVRKGVEVPIGACESASSIYEVMKVIEMKAADFFNFKLTRSGGFYRGKQIISMIDAAGLFSVGSENLGLGIELAANAHFAAATNKFDQPCGYGTGILKIAGKLNTKDMKRDIVVNTPRIENGFLEVPEGPGLGVELNEEAVRKYLTPGKGPILVGRKSN